jgi:hypothetical protein
VRLPAPEPLADPRILLVDGPRDVLNSRGRPVILFQQHERIAQRVVVRALTIHARVRHQRTEPSARLGAELRRAALRHEMGQQCAGIH